MPSAKRRRHADNPATARSCAARKLRADSMNTAPWCRQAHSPWRALDKFLPEPVLQPLQLDADRALRAPKRLRGACEALEIGNRHEGLDRIDVQSGHVIYPKLLSLK